MYRRTDMHLHTHKHACMHGFTYIHIFEHLFTCIHTHVHNMLKWMIQGYPHFRKPPYIYIFIYSIYIYLYSIYIYTVYIYIFFSTRFLQCPPCELGQERGAKVLKFQHVGRSTVGFARVADGFPRRTLW